MRPAKRGGGKHHTVIRDVLASNLHAKEYIAPSTQSHCSIFSRRANIPWPADLPAFLLRDKHHGILENNTGKTKYENRTATKINLLIYSFDLSSIHFVFFEQFHLRCANNFHCSACQYNNVELESVLRS